MIRGKDFSAIRTVHGAEYAAMLIAERIPFTARFEMEAQTSFYVIEKHEKRALDLLMKLRGSKL